MRNANGTGTCYKLKGNRRRPWIARAFLGRDKETGRSIYQTIGYFETRREGIDALTLYRIDPPSPKADMTLEEVYDEWSKTKYRERTSKNRRGISKATINNYRAAWKYMEKFWLTKFRDIRSGDWQEIIDGCEEEGKSDSTIKKIKTLAVMLSDYAMQNDITDKNYAKFIELPRSGKKQKECFTDLEIKAIEKAAAEKIPWADTVLILLYTGFRVSEMLNLTRFNVDLKNEIITGGSKTEAGESRPVPIHPKIMPYVKRWYDKGGEALICDDRGKKLSTKRYREKLYYPALAAMGVRKLSPHKCRHTFCTKLKEAGADDKAIQAIAGHSDYGFTANTYTHPDVAWLRREINKLL